MARACSRTIAAWQASFASVQRLVEREHVDHLLVEAQRPADQRFDGGTDGGQVLR